MGNGAGTRQSDDAFEVEFKDRKSSNKSGCRSGCVITCAVSIFLLVIACWGITTYIRNTFIKPRLIEMESELYVERFFDEPVTIPKEWQVVKPFPEDLLALCAKFKLEWGPLLQNFKAEGYNELLTRIQNGDPIVDKEWSGIESYLDKTDKLASDFAAILNHPDYEMEAFEDSYTSQWQDMLIFQRCADWHLLQSEVLRKHDRWGEAFAAALVPLKSAERHVASPLVLHLIAMAVESKSCRQIDGLARQCASPDVLRSILTELNGSRSLVYTQSLDDPYFTDIVAGLRSGIRAGLPVEFRDDAPKVYYFRQQTRIMRKLQAEKNDGSWSDLALFSRTSVELLLAIALPNFLEADNRQKAAESKYELCRLSIAARIRELEGRPVDSIADLAPELIPEEPLDPFSGEPFLQAPPNVYFYSVGPNEIDEGTEIEYDSTNGTVSSGDIFFDSGDSIK